jgi:hypothetical protein
MNAVLPTCEICDHRSVAAKGIVECAVGPEACEAKVRNTLTRTHIAGCDDPFIRIYCLNRNGVSRTAAGAAAA